ncbi:MAG: hypothetical protein R3D59_07830 [Paracoccaceae bacterium]
MHLFDPDIFVIGKCVAARRPPRPGAAPAVAEAYRRYDATLASGLRHGRPTLSANLLQFAALVVTLS